MSYYFELFVRYLPTTDPLRIVKTFLAGWSTSSRPPLHIFHRVFKRRLPTDKFIEEFLTFNGKTSINFKMMLSPRSGADSEIVTFYLNNPMLRNPVQSSFCSVSIPHKKVEHQSEGYTFDELISLLSVLVQAEKAAEGYIESHLVNHCQPIWEVSLSITGGNRNCFWPICFRWITFIPKQAFSNGCNSVELKRAGLKIYRDLEDSGLIVATEEYPPKNIERHVANLLTIMQSL